MLAVVVALCAQVLFPPHLMAAAPDGGGFVLCNTQAPVVDTQLSQAVATDTASKAFKDKSVQGLKCADCVLASLTGLTEPEFTVTPVVYTIVAVSAVVPADSERPKARAPPRPHSCGPPHRV
ncbi:hypothetical protein PQU92_00930 [Asticcacaulis sp. BYS171W]|uniref:DUF2946 domain-containing protein n=1 Tax=Asticcacaulis aquaticus TaxID=2984212 RepID=A0ABT5HP36_9CAUL|nr:hypothetical protein [Asticcacaulis aquaticus]MDC7681821.1 hypothetical protein [Asticcacaulis aquaticus]